MGRSYNIRKFKVDIELDNGIYVFDEISATGKTYLYKRLKDLFMSGQNVYSITYSDWIIGKAEIINTLNQRKFDVVLFDRFGMYYHGMDELLAKLSRNAIVLVESKTGMCNLRFKSCIIEFSKEGIFVYE